jgi:hypothetical protein
MATARRKAKTRSLNIKATVRGDKRNVMTRLARASAIKQNAPSSPLYTGALQAAGDKVVLSADALRADDAKVQALETQLANAKSARKVDEAAYDKLYDLYIANVQHDARTPADIEALGLVVMGRQTSPLVPPTRVTATFNAKTGDIDVHAAGLGRVTFVVEYASDPPPANGWTRVKGTGARRKISGLASGRYVVQVASARGKDESAFSVPVSVTVR